MNSVGVPNPPSRVRCRTYSSSSSGIVTLNDFMQAPCHVMSDFAIIRCVFFVLSRFEMIRPVPRGVARVGVSSPVKDTCTGWR